MLRTVGQWMRKVRSMAAEFQDQFQEAMREAEMADLKKQVDDMAHDVKNYDPLKDVRADVESDGQGIETLARRQRPQRDATLSESRRRAGGGRRPARRRPLPPQRPSIAAELPAPTEPRSRGDRAGAATRDDAPRSHRDRAADASADAGQHGARRMSREDEEKEIEATKAPLMDHLVELRSRLIKALAAFALAVDRLLLLRQADLQRADLALRLGRRPGEFEIHLHRAA